MGDTEVSILSSLEKLPADGRSFSSIHVSYSDKRTGIITVRLQGIGSFDPHVKRNAIDVPVTDGEAVISLFAAVRPGKCTVSGPGFKKRYEHVPANWFQDVVYGWVPTLALALVIALTLKTFAFANYYIYSGSMLDTMQINDLFFTDRFSYKILGMEPERGDIITFQHPDEPGPTWIKRLIGLPGEIIEIHNGVVYIDGQPLDEPYIREKPRMDFGPMQVPKDHFFVMGDNRNGSNDSRSWGCLPKDNFTGRATFIFWPLNRIQSIPHYDYE